jgi:penicillin-binding protein 1A
MFESQRSGLSLFFVWIKRLFIFGVILGVIGIAVAATIVVRMLPTLPSIDTIREIQLQVPLRVFAIDGQLIGEYGDYRRSITDIDDIPQPLIDAVLAAEDANFFKHHGVDFKGIARAAVSNLRSGGHGQGASTITMQVARNYFLSREKTYTRKLKEILLSFKLEQKLSKSEILELYLNKIFLGHRSYGFQAAALFYFDKPLRDLSLAETAMLAGLPKAPSRNNPLSNPENAQDRRNYVLGRMQELGYVTPEQYESAIASVVTAKRHASPVDIDAPYVAEMARDYIYDKYGDRAYQAGFQIFTTIHANNQIAANNALRKGLIDYEERHSYRGVLTHVDPATIEDSEALIQLLNTFPDSAGVQPALIIAVDADIVQAYTPELGQINIDTAGWSWITKNPTTIFTVGDVVYIRPMINDEKLEAFAITQLPEIAGAIVSLNPNDGAILALSGGFDYYLGKFNRATQAKRQPGSNLKPFIYSAALNNGFTASSLVSGAPIVVEDSIEGTWRPQNYSGKFFGPTRVRYALTVSMNLVSVRLLRAMGIPVVLDHLESLGFNRKQLPKGLSLALGTAAMTPLEIARAYSIFANGGYQVEPYFIARVEDQNGEIIEYSNRQKLCEECEFSELELAKDPDAKDPRFARQVLSPENVFIMNSIMRGVIKTGTGRSAMQLGRNDLAGKTGTTNDFNDAWFSGFNPDVVTTAWVGYDQPKSLGKSESGARAALPIWIDYMRVALDGVAERNIAIPETVVSGYVSEETGEAVPSDHPKAYEEYFIMGTEPQINTTNSELERQFDQPNENKVEDLF